MTGTAPRKREATELATPVAVAYLPAVNNRDAIGRSIGGLVHVRWCRQLDEVRSAIGTESALLLIIHRRAAANHALDALVREIREAWPGLHIIALAESREDAKRDAVALRHLSVSHVVARSLEPLRLRVVEVLALEQSAARREAAAALCANAAPDVARTAVRHAIANGDRQMSVQQLAEAIGVPRKTLDRRFSRERAMTARQLIGWGRLISVAMQLEVPSATAGSVSRDLGFASPSALRNMLQRYTGLTPTQLRENGGLDHMIDRVQRAFAAMASSGGGGRPQASD